MTVSVEESLKGLITHDGSTATYAFDFQVQDAADVHVFTLVSGGAQAELVRPTDFTVALNSLTPGGSITLVDPTSLPNGTKIRVARQLSRTQPTALQNTGGTFPVEIERALDRIVKLLQELGDFSERAAASDLTDDTAIDALGRRIKNLVDPINGTDAATMAWVLQQIVTAQFPGGALASVSSFTATLLPQTSAALWLTALGFTTIGKAVAGAASTSSALDALGAGSKGKAVFTTSDLSSALLALGFNVGIAALLSASGSAPLFRDNFGVTGAIPVRNELIDGDFQVMQFGTSITNATPVLNNDATWVHAAWRLMSNGNNKVNLAQETTDLPIGVKAGIKLTAVTTEAAGAAKFSLIQFIESKNTIPMRNRVVSVSGSIKGLGGLTLTGFRVHLISWSGTADAPFTPHPISAWGAGTTDPTMATNHTIVASASVTATGSHADFLLENKTVPANCNNLGLLFVTNDGAWTAGDAVILSKIQINLGAFATPFVSPHLGEVLPRCERLFVSTFNLGTAPQQNLGLNTGCLEIHGQDEGGFHASAALFWQFPVPMRVAPVGALVTYNPAAANANWRRTTRAYGAGADTPILVGTPGPRGVAIGSDSTGVADQVFSVHASASAQLT